MVRLRSSSIEKFFARGFNSRHLHRVKRGSKKYNFEEQRLQGVAFVASDAIRRDYIAYVLCVYTAQ